METATPRTFISYSWSSNAHSEWVLQLARELRAQHVDVVLDKWDLREGHDANAFMERMVTDPTVSKIVIVSDRRYAERANAREGGVGTEAQILSPQLYAKTDQNKIVVVVRELDGDRRPYMPAYYGSRVYIDLSDDTQYAANLEQLVRWIFDKPLHERPPLGPRPPFLHSDSPALDTSVQAHRVREAIRSGSGAASGTLQEFLSTFVRELEKFRLKPSTGTALDELVVQNISAFLPFRNEFISVIATYSTYAASLPDGPRLLHRCFESMIPYLYPASSTSHFSEWHLDNFRFLVHELFLYTIAILLRDEHFGGARSLIRSRYFVGTLRDSNPDSMRDCSIFCSHLPSLDERKRRLGAQRASIHADLLFERSESSGISSTELLQADFVLFLKDSMDAHMERKHQEWWPLTLIYLEHRNTPFPIFARSESRLYFAKVLPMIGDEPADDFASMFPRFSDGSLMAPKWPYRQIAPERLANVQRLGTVP